MTYLGTVKDGVVVFDTDQTPPEGTRVRVEPDLAHVTSPASRPLRGSAHAILGANFQWAGEGNELDELLADVQRMREQDLDLQRRMGI